MTPKQAWRVVTENQGLIQKVIEKKFSWIDFSGVLSRDDYYQAGLFGLYSAARKYDSSRAKFSTYAFKWIYQAISRVFRTDGFRSVRVPCYAYDRISKLKKKHKEEFEHFIGNGCTRTVKSAYHALNYNISLDAPVNDHSQTHYSDIVLEGEQAAVVGKFNHSDMREVIKSSMKCLEKREQRIIAARYGIDTEACSLIKIAARFRISKQRASQIEQKALGKIRKYFLRKNIVKADVI